MADDLDDLREYHKNRRTGSKKVKIDGTTYTSKTKIRLKDGSTATLHKVFGDPKDPMMNIIRDDGSKQTMRLSNRVTGKPGRPTKETKPDAPKREISPFIKVFNAKANQIAKDTKDGKIKTLADLKQHPSFKSTFSGDIKNKLVGVFKKAGGDTSYKKVEKKVEPSKYDKRGNLLRTPGLSKDSSGVIQIQEKLLAEEARDRRSMSPRAFFQKYGKKMASGGMVNARNGAFIEVQNRFSDRMLPGKKRTTRIY